MSNTANLKKSWEEFLVNKDERSLKEIVDSNLGCPIDTEEYPFLHRVMDLELEGEPYRVIRYYNNTSGQEEIFFEKLDGMISQEGGVPYALTGSRLKRWIDEEIENPSQGPVNWKRHT